MAIGFEVRQALSSTLAGLQPLIDRALGVASDGQMMRQELGLALMLDEVVLKIAQPVSPPSRLLSGSAASALRRSRSAPPPSRAAASRAGWIGLHQRSRLSVAPTEDDQS